VSIRWAPIKAVEVWAVRGIEGGDSMPSRRGFVFLILPGEAVVSRRKRPVGIHLPESIRQGRKTQDVGVQASFHRYILCVYLVMENRTHLA
jgi:hypothetical protein